MEAMRESWTDARLDDFAAHTDRRFDAVDRRFDAVDQRFDSLERRMEDGFDRVNADLRALREETNSRFDRLDGRFDAMQRTLVQVAVAMSAAFIAGFAALVGLVATQL
jgi:hypothetical protein